MANTDEEVERELLLLPSQNLSDIHLITNDARDHSEMPIQDVSEPKVGEFNLSFGFDLFAVPTHLGIDPKRRLSMRRMTSQVKSVKSDSSSIDSRTISAGINTLKKEYLQYFDFP